MDCRITTEGCADARPFLLLMALADGVLFIVSLIDGVHLCVYSPADGADHAEECSKLHYCAEKDSLVWFMFFFVVI